MSICLTHWAIDRRRESGAGPQDSARPLILAASLGGRRLVSAVDAAAAGDGIAPGMTLADARAVRPDLAVGEADPMGDAAALHRLARWCGRWSPWTSPCAPDGIWLDITGCAHLQGGETELMVEAIGRLGRRGIASRAAIADTAGAAWAMARFGETPLAAVPTGGMDAALAPLPVAALRLPPETVSALMRLGLRRIGDLYPMPRPSLVLRFGADLALRLDQALGRFPEPLSPLKPLPSRWARLRFAEPISTPEQIRQAAETLLAALCRDLAAAEEGARRLALTLYRVDGTPVSCAVGTARPSREPRHLLRLLAERLGDVDPGLGIEDMLLAAETAEPQPPTQLGLGDLSAAPAARDGDRAALIDRLVNRLGEARVRRPLLRASHWPERAVRFVPPLDPVGGAALAARPRPVRLFAPPEPIEAVAPVPDDPPLLFRWRRLVHRVRRAEGPERIEAEWWREYNDLRDYYRVEDEDGRRFWLYRSGRHGGAAPARWFLHGVFA